MDIDNDFDLVPDDFADGEHKILDAKLAWLSALLITPADIPEYGTLVLARIAQQLGDRATTEYRTLADFSRLLERDHNLQNMLLEGSQNGYSSKFFEEVNIDPRFSGNNNNEEPAQNEPSRESTNVDSVSSTGGELQPFLIPRPISDVMLPVHALAQAAQWAWNCEYRGDNHRIMLQNINNMERSADHANSVALIQSSGTGKSRMVDEQAKLVFTIPFNLRNPDERREGAYPPEDTDVWQYLCRSEMKNAFHGEDLIVVFFKNLFSEVTAEVKHVFQKGKKLSPGDFALEWRSHLSKKHRINRSQLYKRVTDACKKDSFGDPLYSIVTELLATLNNFCNFPKKSEVKIMLYFDEAHELREPIPNDEHGKTRYDIVWSILYQFYSASVFTVFLSTQSSLTLLAPSVKIVRSSRLQNTNVVWAPITETPFDCHWSFPLQPGEYGLADLENLAFLARFGRPLFWTMLENKRENDIEDDSSVLPHDVMNLARKKLLFDDDIFKSTYSDTAMLVILDVLITIDYEPRRESARKLEMEMVASHMRTAFSVPDHRFYIRSGYPSEPFVAEAASRQMYHYIENDPNFSMAKVLKTNLDHGLIDLGQKGEVVMRLLLRKAYMDAIVAEQPGKAKGNTRPTPNFSKGCSLLRFLEALFSQRFHTLILKGGPDSKVESRSALEVAFKDAVVRFTHFVKAADSSVMTTRGMVMGFLRGSAIVGHNTQEGVDIAIPILLHKDHKIEEASMSAFLVQVKRRHHSGTVNAYLIDAEKLGFFPQGSTQDARPYVTLVAELGVNAPPRFTPNVVTSQSGTRASERLARKSVEEHPRYSIRAYECSEKAWNVVRSHELAYYKHILSTDGLLGDHPRQDGESLQLVRRMLPFWYRVVAWFVDKEPRQISESHEAVEIGSYEDAESELEESTGSEVSMVE